MHDIFNNYLKLLLIRYPGTQALDIFNRGKNDRFKLPDAVRTCEVIYWSIHCFIQVCGERFNDTLGIAP